MQIMSTYGTLAPRAMKKRHVMVNGSQQVFNFKYPEIVHNHYQFQDMIDNHNSLCMHPISMEETWMTMQWPNCVFCFLLAVTVVNVQNAGVYFCLFPKIDALMAWKHIARGLINNRYLIIEQSPSRKHSHWSHLVHHLITLPTHKFFLNGQLVTCKNTYQTWLCSCKAACVRTYCSCSPGELLCPECYATHRSEKAMAVFVDT